MIQILIVQTNDTPINIPPTINIPNWIVPVGLDQATQKVIT